MSSKKRLGRGLAALLEDSSLISADTSAGAKLKMLPIDKLRPSTFQPRKNMNEQAILELANSIREKGVLQPILVREDPEKEGHFEIIAGERRWRAAQKASQHEIPAIIKPLNNQEMLEIGLIENLQREDLSAIEEAQGLHRLMQEFGHTQNDLAQTMGCSRSHVANTLRLLSLPKSVQNMVENGQLTAGHVRPLLGMEDPEQLAHSIAKKRLSVRKVEQIVKAHTKGHILQAKTKNKDTILLENEISLALGLKVIIKHSSQGGNLAVHYKTLDQLDIVIAKLNGPIVKN